MEIHNDKKRKAKLVLKIEDFKHVARTCFCPKAALVGEKNQASYAEPKEAIRGLSRVATNEWEEDGIRVNITPSSVLKIHKRTLCQ